MYTTMKTIGEKLTDRLGVGMETIWSWCHSKLRYKRVGYTCKLLDADGRRRVFGWYYIRGS